MTAVLSIVVGGYLAVVVALYAFQRNLMYLPDPSPPVLGASQAPEMREARYRAADGTRLLSWYHPAAGERVTVVLFQGNAGNISDRDFKARIFLDKGYGVLLAGYRGYGGNGGRPTEDGLIQDARAALGFLAGQGAVNGRLVLYGESLGSGVAIAVAGQVAARAPVAALILEAPFTSAADVAARHYPFVPARLLVKDRFDSTARIQGVRAPVLVVHGVEDRIVPVDLGQALFAAAAEPKKAHWIAGAGHNDLYDYGAADIILEYLNTLTISP